MEKIIYWDGTKEGFPVLVGKGWAIFYFVIVNMLRVHLKVEKEVKLSTIGIERITDWRSFKGSGNIYIFVILSDVNVPGFVTIYCLQLLFIALKIIL